MNIASPTCDSAVGLLRPRHRFSRWRQGRHTYPQRVKRGGETGKREGVEADIHVVMLQQIDGHARARPEVEPFARDAFLREPFDQLAEATVTPPPGRA
jgi:hypothetical protein